jgi:hypothetical protein
MERNVTNPFTEYRIEPSHRPAHDRGPTPLELQRWEDDGGAVFSDASPRPAARHRHELLRELAAAE